MRNPFLYIFPLVLLLLNCGTAGTVQNTVQSLPTVALEGSYYWQPRTDDKSMSPNLRESIQLSSDSTAAYSFWADIRVTKNGRWTLSNDTIHLNIYYHQKTLVRKGNDLVEMNGRVWEYSTP